MDGGVFLNCFPEDGGKRISINTSAFRWVVWSFIEDFYMQFSYLWLPVSDEIACFQQSINITQFVSETDKLAFNIRFASRKNCFALYKPDLQSALCLFCADFSKSFTCHIQVIPICLQYPREEGGGRGDTQVNLG